MCLILYTQRGWTGSDSIDRAFLPGEFKWESSCWWRWVPACWKELRKTIKSLTWNRTKCCYHCQWFCSWYSKARRKASNRCVPHRRVHTSSQKGVSGMTTAGDRTHTHGKTSPGLLSNPITQLLSTTGEAEGDKHCLQYHLGFKLWIYSRPVWGSAKVSRKENTALSSYYSMNIFKFASKPDSWSSLQLTLANLLRMTERRESAK